MIVLLPLLVLFMYTAYALTVKDLDSLVQSNRAQSTLTTVSFLVACI